MKKSPGKKSVFSPYSTWKNIFKKPDTIRYPKEDLDTLPTPKTSPFYRGLHSNDLQKCIGCGTCEDICPCEAIFLDQTFPENEVDDDDTGKRPVIDYGRCSFCAFCVEVCPTGSLNMSRNYIHTAKTPKSKTLNNEVTDIKKAFIIKPDEKNEELTGYYTPDVYSWLDLSRIKMDEVSPEERVQSFIEIVKGFSKEEAKKEASRCVECGICSEMCPNHMDIPGYITAIYNDDIDKAIDIIYETNPFPSTCGRVCTHRCEEVCSLHHRGKPVAIRWLKRYAIDNASKEKLVEIASKKKKNLEHQKSVGIIGSGPAGLSTAYYLVLFGYKVTVYEKKKQAGGVLRYGIPVYRLPEEALDKDIEVLKQLGVEIKTGTTIGKDTQFENLQKKHDAIFISPGMPQGRTTGLCQASNPDFCRAIDILGKIRKGDDIPISPDVLVIGGGNVAMDIARSVARIQKKRYGEVNVKVTMLEDEENIPADTEEIIEASEEGVIIHCSKYPVKIVEADGQIRGLCTHEVESLRDESGNFNPVVNANLENEFSAATIIEAIGQTPDYSFLPKEIRNKIVKDNKFIQTGNYYQTDVEYIFAGGDVTGGLDVITAIHHGNEAAKGIDVYLSGK